MVIERFIAGYLQTNVYLVYDEESKKGIIIDPGAICASLKERIDKLGLTIEYLILTHGHGDHTNGLDFVRLFAKDAKLVACKKESEFLFNRNKSLGKGGIVADIWVRDGDKLDAAGTCLEFIETPGHTPGGMCILANNVLFSGDTLFLGSVGRTDLSGGDEEKILKSLREKIMVLPDNTKVLPGHGEETDIAFERKYNPYV